MSTRILPHRAVIPIQTAPEDAPPPCRPSDPNSPGGANECSPGVDAPRSRAGTRGKARINSFGMLAPRQGREHAESPETPHRSRPIAPREPTHLVCHPEHSEGSAVALSAFHDPRARNCNSPLVAGRYRWPEADIWVVICRRQVHWRSSSIPLDGQTSRSGCRRENS